MINIKAEGENKLPSVFIWLISKRLLLLAYALLRDSPPTPLPVSTEIED
ncbi:hypothetical protein J2S19_003228 [Metabacillus malikii]|uniref:Uncharacterized protein n=1 Tax=Metabacillus malikii TaxID=1504265 RepID=A0ABT9ZI35_9BACI|nr:hypothetical protein [Metabacillus malikii]